MNSQYFLSPRLTATLFSCVAHILALGFAAGVELTAARKPVTLVKVELRFQQAVPLPVGDAAPAGASPPPPAPTPPPKPEMKSTPKPQPKAKPALPPRPIVTPKPKQRPKPPSPPPAVIAALTPSESAPISAPLASPASDIPDTSGAQAEADGNTQRGLSGTGGKTGTGARGHGSQGSGKGSSAQPDYGVNPKPPYPVMARRMGVQGTVVLRVHVHADGSVIAAAIARSSGSELLDDSALRTVREQWRFVPARLNDEPVESWVEVPIRFVLGNVT
ncbi:MAG: energy transducer TonB [Deltaproteobacteria bacterium]|nr:energy transducer TonB [Deltaproteobacteria bacterium]